MDFAYLAIMMQALHSFVMVKHVHLIVIVHLKIATMEYARVAIMQFLEQHVMDSRALQIINVQAILVVREYAPNAITIKFLDLAHSAMDKLVIKTMIALLTHA